MGIKASRAAAIASGHHLEVLNDARFDPAQREYLHDVMDPTGVVWNAGYYSFARRIDLESLVKEKVAAKYNVTISHLERAWTIYSSDFLS